MANKGKTSPARIAADERQTKALELRKAGVSLSAIAGELGYASPSGAYEAIKAALDKARAEPAADLREIMVTRLDEMLVVAWENMLQGDTEAMLAVLRIEERRAKLLGLERREPVTRLNLPALRTPADIPVAAQAVLAEAAAGNMSPESASRWLELLDKVDRLLFAGGIEIDVEDVTSPEICEPLKISAS